jgi:hypothetical protein
VNFDWNGCQSLSRLFIVRFFRIFLVCSSELIGRLNDCLFLFFQLRQRDMSDPKATPEDAPKPLQQGLSQRWVSPWSTEAYWLEAPASPRSLLDIVRAKTGSIAVEEGKLLPSGSLDESALGSPPPSSVKMGAHVLAEDDFIPALAQPRIAPKKITMAKVVSHVQGFWLPEETPPSPTAQPLTPLEQAAAAPAADAEPYGLIPDAGIGLAALRLVEKAAVQNSVLQQSGKAMAARSMQPKVNGVFGQAPLIVEEEPVVLQVMETGDESMLAGEGNSAVTAPVQPTDLKTTRTVKPSFSRPPDGQKLEKRRGRRGTQPSRRKYGRYLKRLVPVVMLLAGLVVYYGIDSPLLEDSRLTADELLVDEAQGVDTVDRLQAFLTAVRPATSHQTRGESPWDWEHEGLSLYDSKQSAAYDNLRDLAEDKSWHPHHQVWLQKDLGLHQAWPHVRTLLQAKAALLVQLGHEKDAFEVALLGIRLSRQLSELWAWPSYQQQAYTLLTASNQILAQLLRRTQLSPAELSQLQLRYMNEQITTASAELGLTARMQLYQKILAGQTDAPHADLRVSYQGLFLYHRNDTRNLFTQAHQQLLQALKNQPFEDGLKLGPVWSFSTRQPFFFEKNAHGKSHFTQQISPLLELPQQLHVAQAQSVLIRTFFALRRYQAEKKSLPAQLDWLVPTYLDDELKDPFSGKSLAYQPAEGLLYSVGVDEVDAGGQRGTQPLADAQELVVPLGSFRRGQSASTAEK